MVMYQQALEEHPFVYHMIIGKKIVSGPAQSYCMLFVDVLIGAFDGTDHVP